MRPLPVSRTAFEQSGPAKSSGRAARPFVNFPHVAEKFKEGAALLMYEGDIYGGVPDAQKTFALGIYGYVQGFKRAGCEAYQLACLRSNGGGLRKVVAISISNAVKAFKLLFPDAELTLNAVVETIRVASDEQLVRMAKESLFLHFGVVYPHSASFIPRGWIVYEGALTSAVFGWKLLVKQAPDERTLDNFEVHWQVYNAVHNAATLLSVVGVRDCVSTPFWSGPLGSRCLRRLRECR